MSYYPPKISTASFTSSTSSIKMSWGKVSNATGYVVYYRSGNKWVKKATTTANNYTFKNLKSGTSYKFTVRAYRKIDGKNYYSESFNTFTSSTKPVSANFSLSTGSRKVTVKWNKVAGATGYKVYYNASYTTKSIRVK